ncbi:52 kDa repressor of the inhibitor of the protein kinase-like [Mytilus edulis]|uniref:52 kDa repressor of the inhibitor of the protein kinase-like n=1 Tax=Mytilus edulis TaxID=6550 RepID=UPI0039F0E725
MSQIETAKIYEWYSSDLPDRDTYYMEIQRWMAFCNQLKDPPTSLSESFILADSDYYPNINTIFHLLLTMPVGSFSALRRLKLWNRTTMTDHRLNGLALLMHIHKDKEIDRNLVLDKFDASRNRRIGALHL